MKQLISINSKFFAQCGADKKKLTPLVYLMLTLGEQAPGRKDVEGELALSLVGFLITPEMLREVSEMLSGMADLADAQLAVFLPPKQ